MSADVNRRVSALLVGRIFIDLGEVSLHREAFDMSRRRLTSSLSFHAALARRGGQLYVSSSSRRGDLASYPLNSIVEIRNGRPFIDRAGRRRTKHTSEEINHSIPQHGAQPPTIPPNIETMALATRDFWRKGFQKDGTRNS